MRGTMLGAVWAAGGVGLLLCGIAGCQRPSDTGAREERGASVRAEDGKAGAGELVLDGRTGEWARGERLVGTAEHVVFRFGAFDGGRQPLQASEHATRIWIDADASERTGVRVPEGDANGVVVGAEVLIELSPQKTNGGGRGRGARVTVFDERGVGREVGHERAGFSFAPTVASEEYEARVSRAGLAALGVRGVEGTGRVRVVVASDADGAGTRVLEGRLGERARDVAAWGVVPKKAAGAVRVVSWNVLKASPEREPGGFARVLRALEADVVLVQEWDDADGRDLEGWFRAHVDERVAWGAVSVPEHGVGVVSRHAVVSDGRLRVKRAGGATVRAMPALVATPMGRVGVMSVHFKCCGSSDGPEEDRRLAEAEAVREALWELFDAGETAAVVVGGDYNLVGSRGPLDLLMDGGDVDGSDLAAAEALVTGDAAVATWRSGGSEFTPGRLDWVVYSDATAGVSAAFVVDTERLSDAELARLGLERGDTGGSDHVPVVVDVVGR